MLGGQHGFWPDIVMLTYRSIILFFVALVAVRIMGKRTIANLAPFDLVVIIIMGSVAALPIEEREIDILHGIWPIVLMSILQYLLAIINERFRSVERVTQGVSRLLVKDGNIVEANLKKERMSLADLVIVLREKDVTNIDDVWEARLEPTGKISVIKKKEAQPLTPKDLANASFASVDLVIARNLERMRGELAQVMAEASPDRDRGKRIKPENDDVL